MLPPFFVFYTFHAIISPYNLLLVFFIFFYHFYRFVVNLFIYKVLGGDSRGDSGDSRKVS